MKKSKKGTAKLRKVSFFILLAVSITIILFNNCARKGIEGYRQGTVYEGGASFSFEYPSFMLDLSVNESNELNSVRVASVGFLNSEGKGKGKEFLFINGTPKNSTLSDYREMLDFHLVEVQRTHKDYLLLEQKSVLIDGNEGEIIVYSYTNSYTLDYNKGYTAFFNSGGFVWKIELVVDQVALDRSTVDFEHILDTFKILD